MTCVCVYVCVCVCRFHNINPPLYFPIFYIDEVSVFIMYLVFDVFSILIHTDGSHAYF